MQWGCVHMEIKNRLFPYPVLCDETDDYNDDVLDVSCNTEVLANDIHGIVVFQLDNEDILDLIRAGYAEYVLHLECSSTSYRKVIRSDVSEIEFSIPKSRVNEVVTVLALVVAKQRITNFYSDTLNEDYEGDYLTFEKASILAYMNLPKIYIFKNYEELAGNESLFSVIKVGLPDDEDIRPITFDANDDRIKILVDAGTYSAYLHYQQKQPLAMSMLVLPALVFVIDELRAAPDAFSERMWFIKMKQYYSSQGKDFIDDIINGERNVAEIAQEMLKSPIGKAYRALIDDEG